MPGLESEHWYIFSVIQIYYVYTAVACPGILFGGGGSTNSVEDRENGDLGAAAP